MKARAATRGHYAAAGVDVAAADAALARVKPALKRAVRAESLGTIGAFGGFFDLSRICREYREPVLVSSTDGVGTKVKVATRLQRFAGLGHDIVNHCADDLVVCGAEPLYFLDYYGTSRLNADAYAALLEGLAEACIAANVALVGGETAEMPGVYVEGELDLVGTMVGVVERSRILTGEAIAAGDALVGLASTGLHTNGYSLARKVFFEDLGLDPLAPLPGPAAGPPLGEALLAPHRNYAPWLLACLKRWNTGPTAAERRGNALYGAAHITGGGFEGNVSRILPGTCDAVIDTRAWPLPPLFACLLEAGAVPAAEAYQVFNMGVGLVLVVASAEADALCREAQAAGIDAWRIGDIRAGSGAVELLL